MNQSLYPYFYEQSNYFPLAHILYFKFHLQNPFLKLYISNERCHVLGEQMVFITKITEMTGQYVGLGQVVNRHSYLVGD